MFQSWRFKLREAEEAFKAGRLEEARRLITDDDLADFLPGKRLATRLAARYAQRSVERAEGGDWESGWRDLEAGLSLGDETDELLRARQSLLDVATREAENHVRRGNASGAIVLIEKLERRQVVNDVARTLKAVARRLESAEQLCRRGRFADAEVQVEGAVALRPDLAELRQRQQECRTRGEQSGPLAEQLHRALADDQWDQVAAVADQLLALAPESRLAQDARRRAWAEVGARVSNPRPFAMTQSWAPSRSGGRGHVEDQSSAVTSGPRFLLWVDGVGGYFVCLGDAVLCGQALPGNVVDLPLQADVSRRHVRISREGESYVLEPLHATRVDGRPVQAKTLLSDGAEIELGTGVRLRFRQPHALSGTARLEFLSRHRTQPYADGVLLMAESCVLGPRWQNHVVCRDWTGDVVLYRQDDELFCRAMEAIEIDGLFCDGRGRLGGNSRVVGSDFSLSLEELDRCSSQPLR
jgi:hypothetical protein